MPSYPTHFNVPKNSADFEELCRAVFARHWGIPNSQIFGCSGQSQDGIDFYGI
jgi:hypothetical protein